MQHRETKNLPPCDCYASSFRVPIGVNTKDMATPMAAKDADPCTKNVNTVPKIIGMLNTHTGIRALPEFLSLYLDR